MCRSAKSARPVTAATVVVPWRVAAPSAGKMDRVTGLAASATVFPSASLMSTTGAGLSGAPAEQSSGPTAKDSAEGGPATNRTTGVEDSTPRPGPGVDRKGG